MNLGQQAALVLIALLASTYVLLLPTLADATFYGRPFAAEPTYRKTISAYVATPPAAAAYASLTTLAVASLWANPAFVRFARKNLLLPLTLLSFTTFWFLHLITPLAVDQQMHDVYVRAAIASIGGHVGMLAVHVGMEERSIVRKAVECVHYALVFAFGAGLITTSVLSEHHEKRGVVRHVDHWLYGFECVTLILLFLTTPVLARLRGDVATGAPSAAPTIRGTVSRASASTIPRKASRADLRSVSVRN